VAPRSSFFSPLMPRSFFLGFAFRRNYPSPDSISLPFWFSLDFGGSKRISPPRGLFSAVFSARLLMFFQYGTAARASSPVNPLVRDCGRVFGPPRTTTVSQPQAYVPAGPSPGSPPDRGRLTPTSSFFWSRFPLHCEDAYARDPDCLTHLLARSSPPLIYPPRSASLRKDVPFENSKPVVADARGSP